MLVKRKFVKFKVGNDYLCHSTSFNFTFSFFQETEEIFQACHRGEENNKRLILLLESGQSPDQKNKNGQTLMTYSIAKGDVNTLRILDSAGANIDEADDNGRTPIMVATLIGAEKKV